MARRLAGPLREVLWIAGFLVVAALAQSLPALRRLDDFFRLHQGGLLLSLVVAGAAGLLLFAGGAAAMVRARGTEVKDVATFAEVKAAFRARAWQLDGTWRRFFAMMLGALLLALALFGTAVVLGPAPVKLLFAGAMLYAALRLAWGLARA
jgi:hypothetical protein